jgi:hypothetical protein
MNNLIDRYLYAVGRRLPKKMRSDIERELKSNLLDALEEKTEGREATHQDVLELLDEFGDPDKIAAEYLPNNRYLIGPELIDLYKMVLMIGALAVSVGLGIALAIRLLQGDSAAAGPVQTIIEFFGTIYSAVIGIVGTVTIIFAIIQYSLRSETDVGATKVSEGVRQAEKELKGAFDKVKTSKKGWSADKLPEVPKPADQAKLGESVAAIIFIVLGLVIFNLYTDKIGLYFYNNVVSEWVSVPIFNVDVFRSYLVFFNILWVLDLLLHFRLIQKGRWGIPERLVKIATSLLGLGVFIALVQNPAAFNISGMSEAFSKYAVNLTPILNLVSINVKIVMVVVIIATLVEVVQHVYRGAKSLT